MSNVTFYWHQKQIIKYFCYLNIFAASYLGSAGNQMLKFQLLPSPAFFLPPFFELLTKQLNKEKKITILPSPICMLRSIV